MIPIDIAFEDRVAQAFRSAKDGQLEMAIEQFRLLIQMAPSRPILHLQLGLLLRSTGMLSESDASLRQACHIAGEDPSIHSLIGINLCEAELYNEGEERFRTAILLDPEEALWHVNLAICLFRSGRLQDGLDECRRAVALSPRSPSAWQALGEGYWHLGDFTEAMCAVEELERLRPGTSEVPLWRGLIRERQARWREAIEEFRQAIQLDVDLGIAYLHLGECLRQVGLEQEACEVWTSGRALKSPQPRDVIEGIDAALRGCGTSE